MTALMALAAVYVAMVVGKSALAARAARREPHHPPHAGADVAVVQAILSGDPRLAAVLADTVRALPAAHLLWLVDADDPVAQLTCRGLAAAHPATHVDVVVLPPPPPATNPKLWKLEAARAHTTATSFLVLDDDTRMPATTLAALVAALGDHDLATSLPVYRAGRDWPSRLLAQFVANNAAPTYLALLPWVAPVTINGMAYVIRRSTLEAIGGFAPLFPHLTDDLAVASRVRAAGGTIFQSARTHVVETTVRDGRHYGQLMHRWFVFAALLLEAQPPSRRILIAVAHGLPPLLFVVVTGLALEAPRAASLGVLGAVLVVRALAITGAHRALGTKGLHAPVASVVSEWLQPLHLLHALVSRRITWRTRRYRVRGDRDFDAV